MGLLDRLKGESESGGTFDCGCGMSFGSQQEFMAHAQKMHPKK